MDGFSVYVPKLLPKEERFLSGRRSCQGCGKAISARLVSKAVGKAVLSQTVIKARFPEASALSAYGYAHDPGGTEAMIEKNFKGVDRINAAAAEDTGTHHRLIQKTVIGINRQIFTSDYLSLTRIFQTNKQGLYICFDNEPHMDGLIQRTMPQPFVLAEKVHPVTECDVVRMVREKQIPQVVKEAGFLYVATACPGFPFDFIEKVQKGLACTGNAFILVLTPCPTGWIFAPENTLTMGYQAVQTGYFPLYEIEAGKFRMTQQPENRPPVQGFLKKQKRFQTFPSELFPAVQSAVDIVYDELLQLEKTGKGHAII